VNSPLFYRSRGRVAVIAFLLAVAVVVVVAVVLWRTHVPVPIKNILDRPDAYNNRVVTVAGTVEDSVSFLGIGGMSINDGTGSIWVAKQGSVPRPGAKVSVRGRVNTMLQIGDLTVVGIRVE